MIADLSPLASWAVILTCGVVIVLACLVVYLRSELNRTRADIGRLAEPWPSWRVRWK